jgi:hypothetical protein
LIGAVSSIQILYSKYFEIFYVNPILIRGVSCQDIDMSELRFKRRFSKSVGTKASVITVPRAIAQAWEKYEAVDLIFNGDCLVIRPIGDNA